MWRWRIGPRIGRLRRFGPAWYRTAVPRPNSLQRAEPCPNRSTAEGITNPPIDELLERTQSKYALVIIAAKRARQINAYYSQLGEGLLEYVGPLVETAPQEKPLSIALREINSDLIEFKPERRPPAVEADAGPTDRRSHCRVARIVLGVGGGIAAYKAADLLRKLTEAGHDVTVVPTASALQFVGAATWAALSHHPVATDVWTDADEVPHVRLGREADLVVVAPATADLLARAAHGLADDLLTNTLLTARCPVLFAPAMHTEMWEHPATVDNVATLRRRGSVVLEPASRAAHRHRHRQGPAARAGRDRPARRAAAAPPGRAAPRPRRPPRGRQRRRHPRAARPRPLPGQRLLRAAGLRPRRGRRRPRGPGHARRGERRRCPTRPAPRSSGSAPRRELRDAVAQGRRRTPTSSSWPPPSPTSGPPARPSTRSRSPATRPAPIALDENPDVLAELVAAPPAGQRASSGSPPRPATTTHDVLEHGRAKLARKGCDLLVVNAVGPGTGVRPGRQRRRRSSAATAPRPVVELGPKAVLAAARLGRRRARAWSQPDRRRVIRLPPLGRLRPIPSVQPPEYLCEPPPVHVRVRHRGPPGQDRRPDQRLDPRRPAGRGPGEPRRGRDADHDRPGARRRRGHHRAPTPTSRRSCATASSRSATTPPRKGFDGESCGVSISIGSQSADIAQGVDTAYEARVEGRRGRDRPRRAPATRA